MLPTFCRVTGNSRNLPKPNYFPLLPPISPVEARRICRLMGKSVSSEDHQYVPLIEFARASKAARCHITSHADEQPHHYQQVHTSGATLTADKCRITAKHQINDNYRYLYPIIKENSYDMKQLKRVLDRMNSRLESLTVEPGSRFVYQVDENHLNLVLPADMEAAIRRGEIENLLISKDGSTALIRLKDGPSLTLTLRPMSPTAADGLLEGAGQDDEVLAKQKQIRQYKKRKISDPKRYSISSSPQQPTPATTPPPEEQEEVIVAVDWNDRMEKLTAGHRSAVNLLAMGTDWRDLLYPKIDTWDWQSFPTVKEEDVPCLPVHEVEPVHLPVDTLSPGFVQSSQVPVLNEDTVGFEAVPVYNEAICPFRGKLPAKFADALDRVVADAASSSTATKLKKLFGDVESLMFLPFVHEVGPVTEAIGRGTPGWMIRTERDGVHFTENPPPPCDLLLSGTANNDQSNTPTMAVGGLMVTVGDGEQRFVVGQQVPPFGFVPGQMVGDTFQPGCVVQNPEGAGFIPGHVFENHGFVAGQIVRDAKSTEPKFVGGQAVQTLFGPRFLPGKTIQTDEGLKFVAGQTSATDGKFHSGQIFQTADGPTFVSGVTFDTPQGARFVAGLVDSDGQFTPGQVLMDGPGGKPQFTAGQNVETADGPLFLPGQSYKTPDGHTKFCPGRQMTLEDGQKRFVPGETMITNEGRQFVAGVLAEERFVPCQMDPASGNVRSATKEEEVFFRSGIADGLPIDSSTFTAVPRKKPDMGYMIQHEDKIKFLPTEQGQDELLFGNEAVKVVPGQLLEMDDTPKFIPGKTIESAMGNIFIPGQAVKTGPNKVEQFVPGQVIDTGSNSSNSSGSDSAAGQGFSGPIFCPGQMVNCETGKKFVPGQVFGSKNGPRFVPGKILMSPSGVSTFIPGQVVYSSDKGSVFVPGNIVDTSSGPYFVPGRVVESPNGSIKFIAGEIIETSDCGPRYVTEHETDLDLLDEAEDQKEIVVQGFPVTPEELRLITAYPFAALHYPTKDGDGPIINSRMLRQMAAAGVAVNKLTNTIPNQNNNNNSNDKNNGDGNIAAPPVPPNLNDVKIVAPKDIGESILGADVFRKTEPPPKPAKKAAQKVPPPPPQPAHAAEVPPPTKPAASEEPIPPPAPAPTPAPKKAPSPVKSDPPEPAHPQQVQPVVADTSKMGNDGDHVGQRPGAETSGPPADGLGGNQEGSEGLAPETAGDAQPANSSRAADEIVGNDDANSKLTADTVSSSSSSSLTKTSDHQQSEGKDTTPAANGTSTASSEERKPVKPTNDNNNNNNNKNLNMKADEPSPRQVASTESAKSTTTAISSAPPAPTKATPDDDSAKKQNNDAVKSSNQTPPPATNVTAQTTPPPAVAQRPQQEANPKSDADSKSGAAVATATPTNDLLLTKDKSGADGGNSSAAQSNDTSTQLNQQQLVKDDGSASKAPQPTSVPAPTKTNVVAKPPPPPQPSQMDDCAAVVESPPRLVERDENSVDRQVRDIFERIKRDLDSVERDPFIKQTLTDAEQLALANGRPDLAHKVRELLDILKNTERDPEVVDLIKQILRAKKEYANAAGGSSLSASADTLSDGNRSSLANRGIDAAGNALANASTASNNGASNSSSLQASPSTKSGAVDAHQSEANSATNSSSSAADKMSRNGESSKRANDESQSATAATKDDHRQRNNQGIGADGRPLSAAQQSANANNNPTGASATYSDATLTSSGGAAGDDAKTQSARSADGSIANGQNQTMSNGTSLPKQTAEGAGAGAHSQSPDDGSQSPTNGEDNSTTRTKRRSRPTRKATSDSIDENEDQHMGSSNGAARPSSTLQNGLQDGDSVAQSQRPTDLPKGLKQNSANRSVNGQQSTTQSLSSPSTPSKSPIDESKMIDKWKYYNSPIANNDGLCQKIAKDGNNNDDDSGVNKDSDNTAVAANDATKNVAAVDGATSGNIRQRKISAERRCQNPRRVTSRSSSRLCNELALSEETMDANGELETTTTTAALIGGAAADVAVIPEVITSARDISREVIDTLRYSRDEAKKEYYTQKILEAVGLVSPPGQRSPSNDSEGEGSGGNGSGSGEATRRSSRPGSSMGYSNNGGGIPQTSSANRSRKSSAAASACIILKDFLQTIVPQEAAHNVLVGDIDYMVIDDEGVRYFESAMGFASRRNSRFDIRQAAATSNRSRSGSHDHTSADDTSSTSGPWPWADVGPRSRRASIDEFRKRLLEQDAALGTYGNSTSKTRSPSCERTSYLPSAGQQQHGRHSVAAFPLSRTSSGCLFNTPPPMPDRIGRRRGSLADDALSEISNGSVIGRKRKVGLADPAAGRKRFSQTSFDLSY